MKMKQAIDNRQGLKSKRFGLAPVACLPRLNRLTRLNPKKNSAPQKLFPSSHQSRPVSARNRASRAMFDYSSRGVAQRRAGSGARRNPSGASMSFIGPISQQYQPVSARSSHVSIFSMACGAVAHAAPARIHEFDWDDVGCCE